MGAARVFVQKIQIFLEISDGAFSLARLKSAAPFRFSQRKTAAACYAAAVLNDHRREILIIRNLLGLAMTYSPTSYDAVPSALRHLTAGFGMGPGVLLAL